MKIKSNVKALAFVLCGVFVLLSTGCATIFNSSTQTVAVSAWDVEKREAVAAKVFIASPASSYRAVTPTTVAASPSIFRGFNLSVDDPCYAPLQQSVRKSVTPLYFLNVFNIYGFGIDFLTGYMFNYENAVTLPVRRRVESGDCGPGASLATTPFPMQVAVAQREPKFDLGVALGSIQSDSSELYPLFSASAEINYFVMPRLTLGIQIANASGDVTDYLGRAPVTVSQSSLLVSAHHFLRDYGGLYVGVATGYRALDVTLPPNFVYEKTTFLSTAKYSPGGKASVEFVPLLLQVGWRMSGLASLGVDLAVPFSRIGLGNPRPINSSNSLLDAEPSESRRLALKAFREFRQPFEIHLRGAVVF